MSNLISKWNNGELSRIEYIRKLDEHIRFLDKIPIQNEGGMEVTISDL